MSKVETPVETPYLENLKNIRDVANYARLCEKSIWNVTAPRGPLLCVKIGSRTLYRQQDVDDWIESRVVRPAANETTIPKESDDDNTPGSTHQKTTDGPNGCARTIPSPHCDDFASTCCQCPFGTENKTHSE